MMYIYVYTNLINNHKYVGQTNDLQKRYNGHKSSSYNIKDSGYNLPIHAAIRKYGLENFAFDLIETVNTQDEANEREIYWIKKLRSHVSENGYNVTWGGNQGLKGPVPFEKLLEKSKLFTGEEILDIQQRLINKEKYNDIIEYYSPRLTPTFLSNINNGTNFKNPNLTYPLKTDFTGEGKFSKEEIVQIKQEIKDNIPYSEIQKRHNIKSAGFISLINNGQCYFDENETYPLCSKKCMDKSWIQDCLYDIIFSKLTLKQIANKYDRCESAIKKMAQGRANKQEYLIYPIRSHLSENQKIFNNIYN